MNGRQTGDMRMKKYSDNKDYKVIAFCVSRFHNVEQAEMIHYVCHYCEQFHCKVMIFSTLTDLYYDDANDRGEKQIYSIFDVRSFDAVVIMAETFKKTNVDREIADRAIAAGVPVIAVNRRLEGCVNIDFSYEESFEQVVRHVVEKHGCKRINYIGGAPKNKFSEERLESYIRVLGENDIPFEIERTGYGYFWDWPALQVLERFKNSSLSFPDAIICANDNMAIAVCEKLKEYGYRVPEDVIVSGFDGIALERYYNPRLTTAAFDWDKVFTTIFQTAIALSEGMETERLIIIPYLFRVGSSCGCEGLPNGDATSELFRMVRNQGDEAKYMQDTQNLVAKALTTEEIKSIFDKIGDYMEPIHFSECWFCLDSFFWEKMQNTTGQASEEYAYNGLKDEITCIDEVVMNIHVSEENDYEGEQRFACRELLPDMERVLQEQDYLLFVPMQMQGKMVGYVGLSFDEELFNPGMYNIFIMNMRHLLEVYWYRILQERLYGRDALTGLYNRQGFNKEIQKLAAKSDVYGNILSIVSLDIDGLQKINEIYGQLEGDQILKVASHAVAGVLRTGELAARVGSDEFAIVSLNEYGGRRGEELIENIKSELKKYNEMQTANIHAHVSIGQYTGQIKSLNNFEEYAQLAVKEMQLNKAKKKEK